MKKEYTPIAMRCNKEQFEAIKPKLEKSGIKFDILEHFTIHVYLINNYAGEDKTIGNNALHNAEDYSRKVYEQWNESIFLEACGIDTIPTLEEVKEYFKDAEIVKCLTDLKNKDISEPIGLKIHYDISSYWIQAKGLAGIYCELWDKKQGYAKIITKKSTEYKITKEQILELKGTVADKWFPEVFKEELVVGEWKKVKGKNIIFCLYENGIYGFINGIEKTLNWDFIKKEELEFPKKHEVFEALRNEAVKKGFVFRASINPIRDIENDKDIIFTTGSSFIFENNKLYVRGYGKFCIFKEGQWATVIQPKQMTHEQIEKELGYKIEIV